MDLQYPVARNLLNIYEFIQKMFLKAIFQKKPDSLDGLEPMLTDLRDAFIEVAKQDKSTAIAGNNSQVYAGLTYGKNSLNETYEPNPGFRA